MKFLGGCAVFTIMSALVLLGLFLMGVVPALTIKAMIGLMVVELCVSWFVKVCVDVCLDPH